MTRSVARILIIRPSFCQSDTHRACLPLAGVQLVAVEQDAEQEERRKDEARTQVAQVVSTLPLSRRHVTSRACGQYVHAYFLPSSPCPTFRFLLDLAVALSRGSRCLGPALVARPLLLRHTCRAARGGTPAEYFV